LALGPDGTSHISYQDHTSLDLKYAAGGIGGWEIEVVDAEGRVGGYSRIALDGDGLPRIAYYDDTNQGLKYACATGLGGGIAPRWALRSLDLEMQGANPSEEPVRLAVSVSRRQDVSLAVSDIVGRRIRTLWRGPVGAEGRVINWDGRDERGRCVAPGVYVCHASAAEEMATLRVVRGLRR
jgi:hypothetical protein